MIEIDSLQEADAGFNTFCIFTGNAGFSAALQTDGKIECLVSLFSQFANCDVFADFNTGSEFNAHCAQNIDFRFQNILFKTEVRNAES